MGAPGNEGPLTLQEAASRLGVHYMTAYKYVRTGLLPASKQGTSWQVAEADLARFEAEDATAASPRRTRAGYVDRLADRLTAADENGASAIVEQALSGGADVEQVYFELIVPALVVIGDRWQQDQVTVAGEHQASAIVLRLLGRVGPRFVGRGTRRGTIVLGAAPGDHHGLPSALLADVLRHRRFEVIDLGADTPARSFVDACGQRDRVLAVGVCATVKHDRAVRDVVQALRGAGVTAPVVAGGAGVHDANHASALGADAWSGTGPAVADVFEQLASR